MRRALAWGVALLLGAGALAFLRPAQRASPPLLVLGPFAELAAEVQWLRFHAASRRGDEARALELAESALALDPGLSAGWQTLAAHLVFDLASREREPDLARRRALFTAGLAVLRHGAEAVARPGELELFRALAAYEKSRSDAELAPGGAPELLREAVDSLARAAALGEAQAAELLPQLRAELAAAE